MRKIFNNEIKEIPKSSILDCVSSNGNLGVIIARIKPIKEYNARYALINSGDNSSVEMRRVYDIGCTYVDQVESILSHADLSDNKTAAKLLIKHIFSRIHCGGILLSQTAQELKRLPLRSFLTNKDLIENEYRDQLADYLLSAGDDAATRGDSPYLRTLESIATNLQDELPEVLNERHCAAKKAYWNRDPLTLEHAQSVLDIAGKLRKNAR